MITVLDDYDPWWGIHHYIEIQACQDSALNPTPPPIQ
jgi:hypothetical protein